MATASQNVGCAACRLRFTQTAQAYLPSCPECGEPLTPFASAAEMFGFRLYVSDLLDDPLPTAIAVSLPPPRRDA